MNESVWDTWKLTIHICSRYVSSDVICSGDSYKSALEQAAGRGVCLDGINLFCPGKSSNDISHLNLSCVSLVHANFTGCCLRYSDLSNADLRVANFHEVSFNGADLTGADMRGVDLTGADMRDVDLTGADLRGAKLRGVLWE